MFICYEVNGPMSQKKLLEMHGEVLSHDTLHNPSTALGTSPYYDGALMACGGGGR